MPQILVVDDEPEVAHTLVALLSSHGFEVITAPSGEAALETLSRVDVDLVFLDVRLPGLSGFETCARIRERHGPALPIVMITAYPDREAVRRGYEAGADDFVGKPVDTPSLILKVRVLLRLKGLHDELLRSHRDAESQVRDLALLHEIGRDWSLIAEPEEFYRMVSQRLAGLIGAPVCLVALYDPATHTLSAALPAHGLPDIVARDARYVVTPEYRALWNFRSGRAYVSNRARSDPRLVQEMVNLVGAESIVLVPMISEGVVLGLLVAANKPGGFTDSDVRLLSIFAGPAASFLRSRQIFERERRHAARLERLSELARDMASLTGRVPILSLGVSRIQKDFGCERVSFYAPAEDDAPQLEAHSGPERLPPDPELLRWALRAARPLRPACEGGPCQLAVPVRAGEDVMGVLVLERASGQPFGDDEQNLLSALAGQMAVTLQNAQSLAATERLARQMATLYDLGLETAALRDLRQLFLKGTEEAGRLIQAHHVSVFRFEEPHKTLRLFAAWAKDRPKEAFSQPVFRLGEGIAGRVAQDWIPAMLNDAEADGKFVPKGNPVSRLLCVPLTYYDREREAVALFGVLNATRKPGHPRFTNDDLEYLTRFAGQLAIAVANSMAFGAERERSEELALVNALIREIAGNLSRERIMETAARRIHEAFRYPVVMIGVPEPDASALRIATAASRDPRPEAWGAGSVSSGAAVRALHERRTVLVSGDAEQAEARLPARIRSELAVPIRSGEDVVAVLYVASDSASAFNRAKMITLETLADGIGIILRNAELYQALERTNAKLVELDRMKSEVVNIVAHDFRAPLAGVLGYAELLEWKPDAPAQERVDQARAIIQSATHMASMVDKTLKTTRLETGHFPFDFGIVDVGAVIREVLARLPIDARHPSMVEMPEDPLPCWADRDRVAEVLDNLLSNAAKYSPDGGKIRLEVRSEGETLTVKVTDSGIGIARQDMDRLFRPFSRLRTRRTAEIEGTGLGLYICERIVRAHGGRMWAESEPGRGSTFAFSLPLFGAAAQTRAPLLLVAAGDEGTRREVRRLAEELGYGIHEVSDGVEALEAAIRLTPSAVILDRVLPKLGAGEVAQRLKETQGTRSVPLFALAARSDLGEQARLFHACVPKPVDRNVLATALEALDTSPSPS